MRRAAVASRFVTATVVVAAAVGGLGIAVALPGDVGTVDPAADEAVPTTDTTAAEPSTTAPDSTTTTVADAVPVPDSTTSSTAPPAPDPAEGDGDGDGDGVESDPVEGSHPDNHGAAVSEVARDRSRQGCEHGRAVSRVASGKPKDKPCPPRPVGELDS